MSSYGCIVPIDWARLVDVVLPDWHRFLAGQLPPSAFAARHLSPAERAAAVAPRARWPWQRRAAGLPPSPLPPALLNDLTVHDARAILSADVVRASGWTEALQRADLTTTLATALLWSASARLPGVVPGHFYCEHHDVRGLRIAGYKSRLFVLHDFFTEQWIEREQEYAYTPLPSARTRIVWLLERLCLGVRTFAGVPVLRARRRFPAYDHPRLLGFLTPVEVTMLARAFAGEEAHAAYPGTDAMSVYVVDLVRASAMHGAGLVTLHDML